MSEKQGVAQRVIESYDDPRYPDNLPLRFQKRGAQRLYRELSYEAQAILDDLGYDPCAVMITQAFERLGLDIEGGAE
jgi:hypothetical protein